MDTITILKIFTFDYSFKTWEDSGTLEREIKIYTELEKMYSVKFIFLTYGFADEKKYESLFRRSKIIPIYTVIKHSDRKLIRLLKTFTIPFKIKNHLSSISLIKQNQLLGSWVAILLKLLTNKPLIIRTGYDMYQFSKYNGTSFYKRILYYLLTEFSLIFSTLYTVTSRCDLDFLSKRFTSTKKITIRPNWVKEIPYKPINTRSKNKVIMVGRLEDQKNYAYMLHELSGLNYEIDIYGKGTQIEELQNKAKKLEVKINLLGTLSNEDLLNIMCEYKFFLSTSKYEGNPKALLEAMSAGCVIFASNIPNNTEIIKKKSGYLFDLNPGSLRNIFTSKKYSDDELSVKSLNGYKYVNSNNSFLSAVKNEYTDYLRIQRN
jgi:glycosyltransferase involved in cell wall biosynthesis